MLAQIVNTAAAANTGRQRELSQSSNGKRNAIGAISDQDPVSRANANPFATDTAATAIVPSTSSRHDGQSRAVAAIPISSGAIVTKPIASDTNQTFQTSRNAAVEGPNSFIASEAPAAAVAVAATAAARNPKTRRRLSRSKAGPNQRAISHDPARASPALHRPNAKAATRLLSTRTLAATVATITPAATGTRAQVPSAISVPAATPEAGQKTATRSPVVRRPSPSRAARK